MRQAYLQMTERHQKEVNEFPMTFVFSDEQLAEALEKLGVKSTKECVTVLGHGDIMKREDAPKVVAMMKRHRVELQEAMKDEQFAYDAFLYEMNNHEYAINWDGDDDVLDCFGYKMDDLAELGLEHAYYLARREHMRLAHEVWEII